MVQAAGGLLEVDEDMAEKVTEAPEHLRYCCGFAMDGNQPVLEVALMIRKEKPEWQRGKLNGIGGMVEPGETPREAMVREFQEETGLQTTPEEWREFAVMETDNGQVSLTCTVHYFTCLMPLDRMRQARTTTKEQVFICSVPRLLLGEALAYPVEEFTVEELTAYRRPTDMTRTIWSVPFLVAMARAGNSKVITLWNGKRSTWTR